MTVGARLGRHQHQHRCCSIFGFFSVVVAAEVSGDPLRVRWATVAPSPRAARDPRMRAVLRSCIMSLSSRESQGCPACPVVEWNVGGEMSRTRAARGPHSSHRTISASTSPTGTPTHLSCFWPWSAWHRHPLRRTMMSCGPCQCQCQRAQTAHGG
jgi:hypothetical protein